MTNKLFNIEKKIVIFGGSGTLGQQFAKTLASANAKVFILDKVKPNIINDNIKFYSCDVKSKKSIFEILSKVIKKEKKIDTMIYSVYSKPKNYYKSFFDYDLITWNEVFKVNVTGAFLASQFLTKHFIKNKIEGNIILVLSTYGIVGPDLDIYKGLKNSENIYGGKFPLTTPISYTSSKSALLGMVKYISTTCGKFNIRANAITPGGVFDGQDKTFVNRYSKKVPLKRMANYFDYNGAILFLSSDASKYMTGTNLVIDGGWTAW